MKELTEFSHETKVLLFVLGALSELTTHGYIEGEWIKELVTQRCIALFDQLVTSGFRPSVEEVTAALKSLVLRYQFRSSLETVQGIAQLIDNWDHPKIQAGLVS